MKEIPPPKADADRDFESTVFSAELGGAEEVDLHGQTVNVAKAELESFLHHAFMSGIEVVKIIHGRGEQKLEQMVKAVLEQESIIEYFRTSQNQAETNGVMYAVIAKRK